MRCSSLQRARGVAAAAGGAVLLAVLVALLAAPAAVAHAPGEHADPAERWTHWNWDLLILPNLTLFSTFYVIGFRNLWRRTATSRRRLRWQFAAFVGGVASLVLALISPLDTLSAQLSWAHMTQHMVLMMVAAPLLVLASPMLMLLWALPAGRRRQVAGWWPRRGPWKASVYYLLWQPVMLWLLYAATLWIWHLPSLYELALHNDLVHDGQHLAFLLTSCLFWRVLIDPLSRLRLNLGLGVLYLFTTSLHAMMLGVFMALAPTVWYPTYIGRTEAWGLSALEDQQIAGFIMWMPACTVYAVVAAAIFAIWLRDPEGEAQVEVQPA